MGSAVVTAATLGAQPPFEARWRTIDGLQIRYAERPSGGERIVLLSPWPESIYAFAPIWEGLTSNLDVLAIDLPGFGQSEGRDSLFAPRAMGDFIAKAIAIFGRSPVHAVGPDVGTPSLLFAAQAHPELFRSLVIGSGAATYPLVIEGFLKSLVEAETLPPINAAELIGGFVSSIRGYAVPDYVRQDYLASNGSDRFAHAAALVRAYPRELAALSPALESIATPVQIVVGRNDPYGLARDAEILCDRLRHARIDILDAGHCVWEERAREYERIVTNWVSGGFKAVA
jgi:pimeloyl-ACP methyl ester carboxylesterase